METTRLKLVTIIAERILEERLLRELLQLGARGYTVGEARGEGTRGIQAIDWEGQNVRIETLVGAEVAERILAHVAAHYFADYAVIVYTVDAEVLRSEKYL
ncbi:MAG TPA: transcriptional regulator [Chloroflexaceae bacterium]|nr:transcriptional regulator [Chloroflexaceae bacterium]